MWTSRAGPMRSIRWTLLPASPATSSKMPFKEGAEVKTGDLLFEIDPRPYQAQLDQALGQVNLYEAQRGLTAANLPGARTCGGRKPSAPSDFDAYR